MEDADFSGYATKNGLKCSDGRTIMPGAFKHQDGQRVPLIWQHQHDGAENVLGHGILENREDGTYVYGYFNETESGKQAKELVRHGDIKSLSIYANRLMQRGSEVFHGFIGEVSLVLAGANPGAFIENVSLAHAVETGDGVVENIEAQIFTGLELEHALTENNQGDTVSADNDLQHADDETVKDVIDSMTEKQKTVLYSMVAEAAGDKGEGDDVEHEIDPEEFLTHLDETITHSITEGLTNMTANLFEKNGPVAETGATLSHSQIQTIVQDADRKYGKLKDSVLAHAGEYGITNIDLLFPEAKNVTNQPELLARRTEWVAQVLDATKKSPFSKIKSIVADLTAEEARAKGYVKGAFKKEEVIQLLRRTTGPTTVYKKQKLDRDDIIDITDFDVVAWLKWEIRFMLDEEIARAILIGDGRSAASEDKIKDPGTANDGNGIRSILGDHEMYAPKVTLRAGVTAETQIEEITRSRSLYRGTGTPVYYTTDKNLTDLLLLKDKVGRRLYDTEAALASALRVSKIVPVEVMEEVPQVLGIIVNLIDYNVGTNRGGEVNFFDDFDIDFNQNKYLMETRLSGALVRPKSAIVIMREQGAETTAVAPSFDGETNTITIPTTTGVVYSIDGEPVTGDVVIDTVTEVQAEPAEGYYLAPNTTSSWSYQP